MAKRKKNHRGRGAGKGEAQRRQRAAARRASEDAAAEAVVEEFLRVARERQSRLHDPATPIPEVAQLLLEGYEGEPVPPELAAVIESRGAVPERIAAIAAALLEADDDPKSVTALSFAATAAREAGDRAETRRLLDEMAARDPRDQPRLAQHFIRAGRRAEALEIIEPLLRDDLTEPEAIGQYAAVMQGAYRRLAAGDYEQPCECGSSRSYADCCQPREQAAVDHFTDRGELYALRDALTDWLPESGYAEALDRHSVEWLEPLEGQLDQDPADESAEQLAAGLAELAAEHALVAASRSDDDDDDTALAGFAKDPATPSALAARADEWRTYVHYGLWLIESPTPAPGLWLTDIVTRVRRYVALAPEQAEGLVRWAVLLAAVVPVDGVWRLGRAAFQLSPTEADAACEKVLEAADGFVNAVAGRPSRRRHERVSAPIDFGQAPPYGVYAGEGEASEPFIRLGGMVTGTLFPRIAAEVLARRATPPTLTNTDGEPMSIITAQVRVADGVALADRLADHPDVDADDPPAYTWLGAEIPPARHAAMLAEARAQLAAQGQTGARLPGPDDPPGRWVRGQLVLDGDELRVEVNSRARLDRLLDVLRDLGAQPELVDDSRFDPRLDLPWAAGTSLMHGGTAAAAEGWEAQWLDESVPALDGMTPRDAAAGQPEDVARLEALLREFEYQGGVLALAGGRGPDVDWLREALDMPMEE